MPVLVGSGSDALFNRLIELRPREVRRDTAAVVTSLSARHVTVRWAAAAALGRGRVGLEPLLQRLAIEKNAIVLAEICDSLAVLHASAAVEPLRSVALSHPSQLVRRYALLAIGDIQGAEAKPFLLERLQVDPSRRVRASLRCILLALGLETVVSGLLVDLRSKDLEVRRLIANSLHFYRPRRCRRAIAAGLVAALGRETSQGARGDLERAIKVLQGRGASRQRESTRQGEAAKVSAEVSPARGKLR